MFNIENDLIQQKRKLEEMQKESENLDAELKSLQDATQEKEKVQSEIRDLKQKIQVAEEQLNKPFDIEKLKQSDDPQILDLLKQIQENEEMLKPEHTEKLRGEVEKLKQTVLKLKDIVSAKKAKAENVKDQPTDGENQKLEAEINEYVERNNKLNKEIIEILSRNEAIEQSKQSQSFLEHLRTSDVFLSNH